MNPNLKKGPEDQKISVPSSYLDQEELKNPKTLVSSQDPTLVSLY